MPKVKYISCNDSFIEEEKKLFSPIYSLHVYSVQAVLPKDSAQLCAVDNSQAKELRKFADSNQIDGNRLAPYISLLFAFILLTVFCNSWSAIVCSDAKEIRKVVSLPVEDAQQQKEKSNDKKEHENAAEDQENAESNSSQSSPEKEKLSKAKPASLLAAKVCLCSQVFGFNPKLCLINKS